MKTFLDLSREFIREFIDKHFPGLRPADLTAAQTAKLVAELEARHADAQRAATTTRESAQNVRARAPFETPDADRVVSVADGKARHAADALQAAADALAGARRLHAEAVERERKQDEARHRDDQRAKFEAAHAKMRALEDLTQRFGAAAVEAQQALLAWHETLSPEQRDRLNPAGRPNALRPEIDIALAVASGGMLGNLGAMSQWAAEQRPALSERFAGNEHVLDDFESPQLAVERAA
jgi:hypothetical protein